MPGNNPNQNLSYVENHAKEPLPGFPGMKNADESVTGRSTQEVAEARVANAESRGLDELEEQEGGRDGPIRERKQKKPRSREV